MINQQNETREEFKTSGKDLVEKIKQVIKAGNARRIIIKNDQGSAIMEIPLTVAVVGSVLAPILAAVGAVAALVMECTIVVIKKQEKSTQE